MTQPPTMGYNKSTNKHKGMHSRAYAAMALACTLVGVMPAHAETVMEQHERLWNTVQDVGVSIVVNDPVECKGEWGGGGYYSRAQQLVICQDGGIAAGKGTQVEWTPNDLDTLRHEAHHIVQDCEAGQLGDSQLVVYHTGDDMIKLIEGSSYTKEQLLFIWEEYGKMGATEKVQLEEVEAMIIAKDIPAGRIANQLIRSCTMSQ